MDEVSLTKRRKAPGVKGTESLTCAREGIRTPNPLICSFFLHLLTYVSNYLTLLIFVSFERESTAIVSRHLSCYLYGENKLKNLG
jgi:hypothetical protein